jgi:hypothetical protein
MREEGPHNGSEIAALFFILQVLKKFLRTGQFAANKLFMIEPEGVSPWQMKFSAPR